MGVEGACFHAGRGGGLTPTLFVFPPYLPGRLGHADRLLFVVELVRIGRAEKNTHTHP